MRTNDVTQLGDAGAAAPPSNTIFMENQQLDMQAMEVPEIEFVSNLIFRERTDEEVEMNDLARKSPL